MPRFGRFEFGKEKATELYDGDYMEVDKRGIVCIFEGTPFLDPLAPPRLVSAMHLEKGQSVRLLANS
jgi:hypothetical protein